MPREHGEGGEFVETVTLEDVLGVFDAVRGPVVLSADVADALDCSRETARRKLEALHDRGDLERRKVARRVVYWRPLPADGESGREHAETPAEQSDSGTHGETDTDDHAPRDRRETGRVSPGADTPPGVDEAAGALDTSADRRAAVRACIDYLREHGTGQKSDFVDAVYPDHPAGFGSPGGWWNKIGKDHLQAVAEDLPGLRPPPTEGGHTWRWDA